MPESMTAQPTQPPAEFEMPRPHRGQSVLYYPQGIRQPQRACVALVTAVGRRNLELNQNGMLREGVRHVDDPVLQSNRHARELGSWEQCGWDADVQKRITKLEHQIEILTKSITKRT